MSRYMQSFKKSLSLLLILLIALSAWGSAEILAQEEWEPLERGAKGEAVELLQERLIELGYLEGEPDGSFGPRTEAAVLAFQLAAELEETGIVDAETMEALLAEDAPLPTPEPQTNAGSGVMVWIPNTGQRYHTNKKCSGMKNPTYVTIEEAIRLGFTPCKKCYR